MTASEGEWDDRWASNRVPDARPELNRCGRHSFKMFILDALRTMNVLFFHLRCIGAQKICTSKYCSRSPVWVNRPFNSHQMETQEQLWTDSKFTQSAPWRVWQLQVEAHPGFMPHIARSSPSDLSVRPEQHFCLALNASWHRCWLFVNTVSESCPTVLSSGPGADNSQTQHAGFKAAEFPPSRSDARSETI